ncbi:MAG: uridine kinase [Deltaproteobacteria bacterium]|nr:uridine kinase [Deltaproteobacteria bacterium]
MKEKVILIGIAGGTGSGKTSVARAITGDCSRDDVALIEQDSYYHDMKNLELSERAKINYDHPKAMDFDLMKQQIKSLLNRKPVAVPTYDYTNHTRSENTVSFSGQHIVVLEGILALYDAELRDLMDIKIFVHAPDDIRILRRIRRDLKERGRDFDTILEQYYETVRPMHMQFVEPTKRFADIIVPEGAHNHVAIDILRTKIKNLLEERIVKS